MSLSLSPNSFSCTIGSAVSVNLNVIGTIGGALNWVVTGLPAGLSLINANSTTATIVGTPTQSGVFSCSQYFGCHGWYWNGSGWVGGDGTAFTGDIGIATSLIITVNAQVATITLSGLSQIYDGLPKFASCLTTPTGLNTSIKYSGQNIPVTNAGSYLVDAYINDSGYTGYTSTYLNIMRASGRVSIGNLLQTYSGIAQPVSIITYPNGLATTVYYNGATGLPSGAGDYIVNASINDQNYLGTASAILSIKKPTGFISLSGLDISYNGYPQIPSYVTSPSGLNVDISYGGQSTPPTSCGQYPFVAEINDSIYQGYTTGLLNISKSVSRLSLFGLTQFYNSYPLPVGINTIPSGLGLDVTYNGLTSIPIYTGTYNIVANVNDPNYTGSITGIYKIIDGTSSTNSISGDIFLDLKKNGDLYTFTKTWEDDFEDFSRNHLTGLAPNDPGAVVKSYGGTGSTRYNIDYGVITSGYSGLYKKAVSFKNFQKYDTLIYTNVTSNDKAWASYNVSTGMNRNSRNVFSYSFELAGDIYTSGSILVGTDYIDPLAAIKSGALPKTTTGVNIAITDISGYCISNEGCDMPGDTPLDAMICWTGEAFGTGYDAFISGVERDFASQKYVPAFDGSSSSLYIQQSKMSSGIFESITGSIYYNNFLSGDSLSFSLYNYDYTGVYRNYHLFNNPPYPTTGFTLYYPNDFSGIDNLTDVLNSRLRDVSYPVWYIYDCLSGQASGMFITGSLLSFEKEVDLPTGDLNYNNIIKYSSNRNFISGLNLSIKTVPRRDLTQHSSLSFINSGISYLLPNTIELQGLYSGEWLVLDRQENLYDQLTGLSPLTKDLTIAKNILFASGDVPLELAKSGVPTDSITLKEVNLSGGFKTLKEWVQNGVTTLPPHCGGAESWSRTITVQQPTGWPAGALDSKCGVKDTSQDVCQAYAAAHPEAPNGLTSNLEGLGMICKGTIVEYNIVNGTPCYYCTGSSGNDTPLEPSLPVTVSYYRTGWNLNPTGAYLNCLLQPDYDITKLEMPEYRIVLKDCSGRDTSKTPAGMIPRGEIYLMNINFFGGQNIPTDQVIFSGDAQCIIGADYVVDVQDNIVLPFTSRFDYTISGEDRSGVYRADNQPVSYTPTLSERAIKFPHSSGQIVGDVTGFLTRNFTASGFISQEINGQYFYDPVTNEVTFSKTIYKYVPSGSGIVSGDITVINPSVIANQQVRQSGIFGSVSHYVEFTQGGQFTGVLPSVPYTGLVTGYTYLTGIASGRTASGRYNYSMSVSGSGIQLSDTDYPFYPFVTGSKAASLNIFMDMSKMNDFDNISINNQTISYNHDTTNYLAPSFFSSIDSLTGIINSNQSSFNCYASGLNGTGISLVSTLIGDSGNSATISISSASGMTSPYTSLTGGKTFYSKLSPLGSFNGVAFGTIYATGFYTGIGSGQIVGNISQFQGVRHFSDVWDISTGDAGSFKNRGLLSGNNQYYSRVYSTGLATTTLVEALSIYYTNYLNTFTSEGYDVAELTVSGINFGLYGSGITFRITGTKNS